nr:OB-fold nucleic acid binding domain-containing protein [Propionibacterium sp.]
MAGLRAWWRNRHSPEPGGWEDRRRADERATPDRIADCADRQLVRLRGTIESLTVQPRETANWLEASLVDGTGTVTLIWMGRHEIPGIEVGRDMSVEGRISIVDGERRIYNPYYTLR